MPPAHPQSDAASGPERNSALVTRGSAPEGTFSIPEDGLRVPEGKSFLARFQQGLSVRASRADDSVERKNGVQHKGVATRRDALVPNGNDISGSNEGIGVNMKPPFGDAITTPSSNLVAQSHSKQKDEVKRNSSPKPRFGQESKSDSNKAGGIKATENKSAEDKADEAEDVLINVLPDGELLLHEGRPSYPILRFCASTGLVDQHFLDTLGLPLGFVWSPFGELRSVRGVDRPPKRCGTCGSFVAKGNGGQEILQGSPFWTCGFCGRNDNDSGEAGSQGNINLQTFPELFVDTVEYSHPESSIRQPSGRGAIVLVVDENVEPEEAEWARAATAAVHAATIERGLRFAFIKVGAGCSVAVQQKDGGSTPVLEMMSVTRAAALSAEEKEKFFLAPNMEANGTFSSHGAVHDIHRPYTDAFISSRALPGGDDPGSAEEIQEDREEGQTNRRKTRFPSEAEPRRLDIALSIAFELISGMADCENSRVLSLITGPPSPEEVPMGPDYVAVERSVKKAATDEDTEINPALARLYEQIGQRAGDMHIALDFLCFGAQGGFAGPVLLGAARRSRGGLVYTAAHSFSAGSALAEAAIFLSQRSTSPGVVSIRVSSPFTVARVIGPAFPTAAPHTYAVPGIDPTTGFTVVLQSKTDANNAKIPSHAVVQLAAKSLEKTRVITARIPVTSVSEEYLNNLDAEICALVLGKACVVSGGALIQPVIAARSIDISARRLLRGSEATAGVVRLLYELRRGLLIEKQVNPDCALVLRSFFLRAECGIASLLMSPRLFTNATSDESTGLMAEVPLEKSYIVKEAVLVLDTGFNVFVYVGEDASSDAEEAISESARSVAAQRLSPCQLWKLRPGPDAEYLLDSYLSPKDHTKGGAPPTPVEQGFIQYCKSLAPDSITVRLLQSA